LVSGIYVVPRAFGGGIAGSDLSSLTLFDSFDRCVVVDRPPVFLRRRAIRASWHSIQKMPWDVRAYRRFSIFLLQLRHLKQLAQKAWSPVRIAKSSILFPQLLQLYVQLLQIREPSPRRRRFASESRRVPQVLHLKQSICHRFPARITQSSIHLSCVICSYSPSSNAFPSSRTCD
jgi:hypothetical protein